ncbi:hypothetical protein D3C75_498580 [compost metagenome]
MPCVMITDTVTGISSGNTTVQKRRKSPAPSICAASSTSTGTPLRIKPVYRNVENGRLQVTNIRIGVYFVLGIPMLLIICTMGIKTICPGTTRPARKNR